jgi:PPOX class probable F420-dependent enzyme
MPSRRDLITMTEDQAYAFLASRWVGVLGTVGADGLPHLVNVGYLVEGKEVVVTSFAAAQKVKNIERTGSATLLVEHSWPYVEVQGVMLGGPARIVPDFDTVLAITTRMRIEHAEMSGTPVGEGTPDMDMARHARKRVAVFIEPARLRSWDHTRLDGTY